MTTGSENEYVGIKMSSTFSTVVQVLRGESLVENSADFVVFAVTQ